MRVVAITGVAGYIGSGLARKLQHSSEVDHIVGIDLKEPRVEFSKGHAYKADVRHPQVTEIFVDEKVDTVVHLAFVQDPIHQSSKAHELDVIGTMKVLNAAAAAGAKKVILTSSHAVYGPHVDNPNFLTEDRPLRGLKGLQLAKDKIEVERLCQSYRKKHPETTVTILRPATVLGPHASHIFARYFNGAVVPTLMGFDPLLQFIHEDDMVEALYRAIIQDGDGVFNVAADGIIPLSKAIRLAGKTAMPVPHFLAFPVQNLLWSFRASVVPPAMLNYLRYLNVMSNERFKAMFGFQPKYSSEQTFVDFIERRRVEEFQEENPDDLLLPDVKQAKGTEAGAGK